MTEPKIMIDLQNVSKWYKDFQVLTDCSTQIRQGEVVVVCGPSGSGKSTLIQHFNGLIRPTSGKIYLDGTDIWADKTNVRCISH